MNIHSIFDLIGCKSTLELFRTFGIAREAVCTWKNTFIHFNLLPTISRCLDSALPEDERCPTSPL